ncbi:hypothetical protein [Mycobacterium branderi]|uniref:hypothetical protein n=1 Tax=Mycobacterium branderi TaxID=43348 RepID=UPI00355698AC
MAGCIGVVAAVVPGQVVRCAVEDCGQTRGPDGPHRKGPRLGHFAAPHRRNRPESARRSRGSPPDQSGRSSGKPAAVR